MTNREKLIKLRARLNLTQTAVAELLEARTRRPCKLRTVQSWEAPETAASRRQCPDWVIVLLEEVAASA